jgi:acetate kinase
MRSLERENVRIITLHLGNGCSVCAINGGKSVNTSMGFTPLEGLLMGTRCGDLDVSVLEFLQHKEGMNLQQIMTVLNKESGLLGLSGLTSDMRELLEEEAENQDRRAKLAINIYCKRARSYIGRYHVELGGADAVVFTGGIGQNSPSIRRRICEGLECIGLRMDPKKNDKIHSGKAGLITGKNSKLRAYAFPTNEELLIARDTVRVIEDAPRAW